MQPIGQRPMRTVMRLLKWRPNDWFLKRKKSWGKSHLRLGCPPYRSSATRQWQRSDSPAAVKGQRCSQTHQRVGALRGRVFSQCMGNMTLVVLLPVGEGARAWQVWPGHPCYFTGQKDLALHRAVGQLRTSSCFDNILYSFICLFIGLYT